MAFMVAAITNPVAREN